MEEASHPNPSCCELAFNGDSFDGGDDNSLEGMLGIVAEHREGSALTKQELTVSKMTRAYGFNY